MALRAVNEVAFEGFHVTALLSDENSVKRTLYCAICLFRNRAFSLSQFVDALVLLRLALVLKSSATFSGVLVVAISG